MSKWIKCEERLPDEGEMVLVTIWGALSRDRRDSRHTAIAYRDIDGWNGIDGFPLVVRPVAWMPIPEPYNGEETESELVGHWKVIPDMAEWGTYNAVCSNCGAKYFFPKIFKGEYYTVCPKCGSRMERE